MIVAVVVLGLTLFALIALIAHREIEHGKTVQGLLDRIEAPDYSRMAASLRVAPTPPALEPTPDVPAYVPQTDADLQLLEQLG